MSAALPASNDVAGFTALTFTDQDACALVDAGTLSDTWTAITDNTMCTDGAGQRKGKREFGVQNLTVKYYKGDAVAVILKAAFQSAADVISIKIELTNGDKRFYTAQVAKYDETYGATGQEVENTLELWQQTPRVEDGV